jgi:deoxyribose-phosphate aldolase
MIDHSLLNPTLTQADLHAGIDLALRFDVASVCILPYALKDCAERLRGSDVRASTTIGFPHGGHTTAVKILETRQALSDGGEELDMVVNISRVLSGEYEIVAQEIAQITAITHDHGQKVKVIFENAYLKDEHKIRLCLICGEIGVDWVKTSTGYAPGGATDDDLRLMRAHSPAHVQVKAAGGIRDFGSMMRVREIGVTRVGASRTADMLNAARESMGLELIESVSAAAGY